MNAPARKALAADDMAISIEKENYQLINAERSAQIEEYRFGLLALSELAADDCTGVDEVVTLTRLHLKSLFATLERSLGQLIGPDVLPDVWLPNAVFQRGAVK